MLKTLLLYMSFVENIRAIFLLYSCARNICIIILDKRFTVAAVLIIRVCIHFYELYLSIMFISILIAVACTAAFLNARMNGVEIRTCSANLISQEVTNESAFDVILVGDLLYDEQMTAKLLPWLDGMLQRPGSTVLLADPGRHGLTKELRSRLHLCRTYPLPQCVQRENHGFVEASVWKLVSSSVHPR